MENRLQKFIRPLTWLFLALEAASCSLVRESRDDCPCELTVEFRNLPSYPVSLSLTGDGFRKQLEVPRDTLLRLSVPKSGVQLLALAGTSPPREDAVYIPRGMDCPPIYLHTEWLETAKDTARVAVKLEKHFCTLSLLLEGPPGEGDPFWAQVRGLSKDSPWMANPWRAPSPAAWSPEKTSGFPARIPGRNCGWTSICPKVL